MAKNVNIAGGGGGGVGSDELTSLLSDVVKGKTAVTSDSNDDPGVGTLELTGNAVAAHVLTGESFYTTDPKNKIVGAMTVNSILSFSVAAYSGRRVLLKWQNPYAAPGKPYCGVIIKASTGGYPAWNAPAWDAIYAGAGDNVTPGGWSQAFMDLPALNTTYYFTCFGYATTSFGDIWSPVYDPASIKQATVATGGVQNITITGTQVYTIPDGFSTIDVFCVGGGGNGSEVSRNLSSTNPLHGGAGGGGGYTNTAKGVHVTPGQQIAATVGGACAATSFGNICTAGGGQSGIVVGASRVQGGNGGSGGGGDGDAWGYAYRNGGSGGQDGGNGRPGGGTGEYASQTLNPGTGQGRTTRAFGEAGNTLYSGGGGSGSGYWQSGSSSEGHYWTGYYGGAGGAGGGGNPATNGGAGTGGGGGGQNRPYGDQSYRPYCGPVGYGGSGVILLRLY